MNIQGGHSWRSANRTKVRGVVIGNSYYRITFIGDPDAWEIEAIGANGPQNKHRFESRREAQEFLESKR